MSIKRKFITGSIKTFISICFYGYVNNYMRKIDSADLKSNKQTNKKKTPTS